MTRAQIGVWGEDLAAQHLCSLGFNITARNFHSRHGEIDIIAKDDRYVVFAEVKVRARGSMVSGVQAVSPSKMRKIVKTALVWLSENQVDLQPRFDIIDITTQAAGTTKLYSLDHIENAFGAEVCDGFF